MSRGGVVASDRKRCVVISSRESMYKEEWRADISRTSSSIAGISLVSKGSMSYRPSWLLPLALELELEILLT